MTELLNWYSGLTNTQKDAIGIIALLIALAVFYAMWCFMYAIERGAFDKKIELDDTEKFYHE